MAGHRCPTESLTWMNPYFEIIAWAEQGSVGKNKAAEILPEGNSKWWGEIGAWEGGMPLNSLRLTEPGTSIRRNQLYATRHRCKGRQEPSDQELESSFFVLYCHYSIAESGPRNTASLGPQRRNTRFEGFKKVNT